MTVRCRLCNNDDLFSVINLGEMPIAHRMLKKADADEALFSFHIIQCPRCGLSQIETPVDPNILYADFNFNFSGWKNEPHMQNEIEWLLDKRRFGKAIDIGCNDGRFLTALRDKGIETCIGIEPNPVPAAHARERGFPVFNKMLDMPSVAEIVASHGRFDLVTSRQVIEHTVDPVSFLKAARSLLADNGMLFLDMPDFEPTLRLGDISTLWEEHPNYFTEPTLRRLLSDAGFACTGVKRYDFSGGCLAVTAVKNEQTKVSDNQIDGINRLAKQFDKQVECYGERLRAYLQNRRDQGAVIVLYGVGVRGCTAVNGYRLGDIIDFAIDDQKERQGLYLPGARLEIKAVDAVADQTADVVILLAVNNENEESVKQRLVGICKQPFTALSICGPQDFNQQLQAVS